MATNSPFGKLFSKINARNAPYLFVGGVVILSIATLIMVVSQPDAVRTAPKATENKLYLSTEAQNLAKDSLVEVKVMADSGDAKVNAVQAKIEYPAEKLLFYGVRQSAAFPVEAATNTSTPGVVMVGRGTELGSAGISGKNEVVTLTFRILGDNAKATLLNLDPEFSMLVQTSDNANILSGTSGTYLISN